MECAERDVLKFICEFIHFISHLHISTEVLIIMSSPGQKRGTCGHVMAIFDGHLKCARCRNKGVGEDNCILKKDCPICKAFTPEQVQQLATPTYRDRKNKEKKMVSLSDQESLTLHQVKAHDVTAFAASKAFQGGVSLE